MPSLIMHPISRINEPAPRFVLITGNACRGKADKFASEGGAGLDFWLGVLILRQFRTTISARINSRFYDAFANVSGDTSFSRYTIASILSRILLRVTFTHG